MMALEKIISGGQTGVDRGALDAALAAHFPCGGWCPADRRAEDGPIPAHYPLTPLARGGYRARTRQNVIDSDGTVILFSGAIAAGELTGGTKLTHVLCRRVGKPCCVIDATQRTESEGAEEMARFIDAPGIRVLNVAGPRGSQWPDGYEYAVRAVRGLLERVRGERGALTRDSVPRGPESANSGHLS
jgi:Circularly permutated YpsA SLOG family